MRYLLLTALCAASLSAQAAEFEWYPQGVRARGMGTAFTAVANDDSTLFYNPAGLSSVTHSQFTLFSFNAAANSNVADYGQKLSDANTDAEKQSVYSELTGKRFHVELGAQAFSFVTTGFGISNMFGSTIDFTLHNPAFPYFESRIFAQGNLIVGASRSFMDNKLDIGVSVKGVSRSGYVGDIHVADPRLVKYLNSKKSTDDTKDLLDSYGIDTGFSPKYAADIGATWHYERYANFRVKSSFVVQNLGNLDFGGAGKIPTIYNIGTASESEFQGFDVTLAADYVDLTCAGTPGNCDLRRNIKLGAEIGWEKTFNGHHFLSLRGGLNGAYSSYGFGFSFPYLFGLTIDYANWGEEIGNFAGDKEDRRQQIQFAFIF